MVGFVFRLIPSRPTFPFDMTSDERAAMTEHAAYWTALAQSGTALAFGPVAGTDGPDGASGPYGIGIVLARDRSEAERLRDGDPAMRFLAGFRTEISPMLSLVTPEGRFDAPRPG